MTRYVRVATIAALLAAAAGVFATPAAAHGSDSVSARDAALTWDAIMLDTLHGASGYQPIYEAYVQAAVYDAFTKIDGTYRPYHDFAIPAGVDRRHASRAAAIAAAATTTMLLDFPNQPAPFASTLQARYDAFIASLPTRGRADGIAIGVAAANDIVAFRAGDGVGAPITFVPGLPGPGVWQFVPPPSAQVAALPWIGHMRPFLLRSPAQFRPGPPPALTSRLWARDYEEVRLIGSATSTTRTAAQSATAFFETANTPDQYNIMWSEVATSRHLGAAETVRLLALGNLAIADALIACFDAE